jgi:flagellar basal body-associated protein FliL
MSKNQKMKKSSSIPLYIILGTVLLVGAGTYLFLNNSFDRREFEFDTYDEDNEDYL